MRQAQNYKLAPKYWLVKDVDEPLERENLKAILRSGDYLGLLASDLDEISQIILDTNEQQSIVLQHLVNDLLFLDRNYKLVPKTESNRETAGHRG